MGLQCDVTNGIARLQQGRGVHVHVHVHVRVHVHVHVRVHEHVHGHGHVHVHVHVHGHGHGHVRALPVAPRACSTLSERTSPTPKLCGRQLGR